MSRPARLNSSCAAQAQTQVGIDKMKRSYDLWLTLLLVVVCAARASGDPGEGLHAAENVVVRPVVEVAASADNNPHLYEKGKEASGAFIDASAGALVAQATDTLHLDGTFWARFRRFDNPTSGANHDDYSEMVSLSLGRRDDWNLKLHEHFARVSDYELVINTMDTAAQGTGDRYLERPTATPLGVMERTERVDRYLLDAGLGAGGPLTDKTVLDMVCDYGFVKYLVKDLYDSDELGASVKASRKVTDKSSAILVGELVRMENNSLVNPVYSYTGRLGWRWQGTFKSRFEGSIGYFLCNMDEPGGTNSFSLSGLSYDVAWYWQIHPRLSFILGGRSEAQLAADTADSVRMVDMITASTQYYASKRLTLSLLAGYRHEDYTGGTTAIPVQRVVEQLHSRLRGDYQLLKWLRMYGELWMENTTDNVRGAYQETRATLGLKAEY